MKQHNTGFLDLVQIAKTKITETNVVTTKQRIDNHEPFYLIDVREDNEWARGHCKGAIHISKGILERDIERHFPDHSTPLVLYCGGGYRSALAAASLLNMGYQNVMSMDGGFSAWCESGFPIEN